MAGAGAAAPLDRLEAVEVVVEAVVPQPAAPQVATAESPRQTPETAGFASSLPGDSALAATPETAAVAALQAELGGVEQHSQPAPFLSVTGVGAVALEHFVVGTAVLAEVLQMETIRITDQ